MRQINVGRPENQRRDLVIVAVLLVISWSLASLDSSQALGLTRFLRSSVLAPFIATDAASAYVITHGTDTMPETAEALEGLDGKTIVLTGALSPARFRSTDAIFNVGMAVAAVQVAAPGVYIAMSGQLFAAGEVRKNRSENRFEKL